LVCLFVCFRPGAPSSPAFWLFCSRRFVLAPPSAPRSGIPATAKSDGGAGFPLRPSPTAERDSRFGRVRRRSGIPATAKSDGGAGFPLRPSPKAERDSRFGRVRRRSGGGGAGAGWLAQQGRAGPRPDGEPHPAGPQLRQVGPRARRRLHLSSPRRGRLCAGRAPPTRPRRARPAVAQPSDCNQRRVPRRRERTVAPPPAAAAAVPCASQRERAALAGGDSGGWIALMFAPPPTPPNDWSISLNAAACDEALDGHRAQIGRLRRHGLTPGTVSAPLEYPYRTIEQPESTREYPRVPLAPPARARRACGSAATAPSSSGRAARFAARAARSLQRADVRGLSPVPAQMCRGVGEPRPGAEVGTEGRSHSRRRCGKRGGAQSFPARTALQVVARVLQLGLGDGRAQLGAPGLGALLLAAPGRRAR
jgi:hypothetical protein